MNEMTEMLREFLTGEDMFDEKKGRKNLEETMTKFANRSRGQRLFYFVPSVFIMALMVYSAVKFLDLPGDVATPDHVLYAVFFMVGVGGIALLKLWMFYAHYHMEMMKAQKRMEFRLIDELNR